MFPEPLRISLISHKKTKGGGERKKEREEKKKEGNKKLSMNWFCALTMRIKTSHSLQ